MKTKTLLFSNFKFYQNSGEDNKLNTEEVYNVNQDNNCINTEISSKDVLQSFFEVSELADLYNKNETTISSFKQIIPYNFYDENINRIDIRLFALSTNNDLHELNRVTNIFEKKYTFQDTPNIILSENILYFLDINNSIIIKNSNVLQIERIPKIRSFLHSNNKTYFCCENFPNYIFETEKCNILNISNNTEQYQKYSINIEYGEVLKIIHIKNKIYAITQYAILKLDSENNNFTSIIDCKLELYKNSLKLIDDKLILYSSNGLYYFDGVDLSHIITPHLKFDKNANIISFNRNLYIFNPYLTNIILKYDINNKTITQLKIDNLLNLYIIKCFNTYNLCASVINNNICNNITLYNNEAEEYLGQKISFSPNTLGSTENKTIETIIIKSTGCFNLKIKSDITNISFKIENNTTIKNLCLNGSYFIFEISSLENFSLKSILISYEENS